MRDSKIRIIRNIPTQVRLNTNDNANTIIIDGTWWTVNNDVSHNEEDQSLIKTWGGDAFDINADGESWTADSSILTKRDADGNTLATGALNYPGGSVTYTPEAVTFLDNGGCLVVYGVAIPGLSTTEIAYYSADGTRIWFDSYNRPGNTGLFYGYCAISDSENIPYIFGRLNPGNNGRLFKLNPSTGLIDSSTNVDNLIVGDITQAGGILLRRNEDLIVVLVVNSSGFEITHIRLSTLAFIDSIYVTGPAAAVSGDSLAYDRINDEYLVLARDEVYRVDSALTTSRLANTISVTGVAIYCDYDGNYYISRPATTTGHYIAKYDSEDNLLYLDTSLPGTGGAGRVVASPGVSII